MKALCVTEDKTVRLREVPAPEKAEPEHLLVKMIAAGINPGDHAFIGGVFPKGAIPVSLYAICGVSGVGRVEQVGSGVPNSYVGRLVTIYRSLRFSDSIVGTWSEKAHVHRQHCVLLPDNEVPEEYAGSLVNIITPLAFLKQVQEEGHKGIIATAGTSATGLAMLGICAAYGFPLISLVRNEKAAEELAKLGARHVLVQTAADLKEQLSELSQRLSATAVFDGVGGTLLNTILDVFPRRTTIYSYGYLGGFAPLTVPLGLIMGKDLTIKSFGNFTSKTVMDPKLLDDALAEIGGLIHQPYFKTKPGQRFSFEEAEAALRYTSTNGGKAILDPGGAKG